MKNKLRVLIREQISKLFENGFEDDYISSFEPEDIPELQPGGAAYQAAAKDIKSDPSMGKFKDPSEEELKNIIQGLKQANLDLPSDQELIRQAEKDMQRKLNPSEIDKIQKTKKRMENLMGVGSYNESFMSKKHEIPQEEIDKFYNEYLIHQTHPNYNPSETQRRKEVMDAMESIGAKSMSQLWLDFDKIEKASGGYTGYETI
jgi:hypothetical protein